MYNLLFSLVLTSSFAQYDPLVKTREVDNYKIVRTKVFSVNLTSPPKETFTLFSPDGKALTNLENFNFERSDNVIVCSNEVMWFSEDRVDEIYKIQILSFNLAKKVNEVTLEGGLGSIRVSPDCKKIAYTTKGELRIFDRQTKKSTFILKADNMNEIAGFLLHNWSQDGKKLWFESGTKADSPNRFGYFEDEKINWTNPKILTDECVLEPNLGWLAHSDYPIIVDAIDWENYRKAKHKNELKIINLFDGREILVDKNISSAFKPKWLPNSDLQYSSAGKSKTLPASTIRKQLKK